MNNEEEYERFDAEDEEYETYEEVPTEEDYYEDEDITGGDIACIVGIGICVCIFLAFVFGLIKKTFKNVHLKVGNKFEIGVETKEDNKNK